MVEMLTIYALVGSIVVLGVLVYLMYKEGSADSWKEISKGAKQKIRGE